MFDVEKYKDLAIRSLRDPSGKWWVPPCVKCPDDLIKKCAESIGVQYCLEYTVIPDKGMTYNNQPVFTKHKERYYDLSIGCEGVMRKAAEIENLNPWSIIITRRPVVHECRMFERYARGQNPTGRK